MQPDYQFCEWWTACLGKPALKHDGVIPIYHALQGHPESPRLWDKYITKMLVDEFDFQTCTHESCLYYKRDDDNNLILITHQVDDLKVSAKDSQTCDDIAEAIQKRLTFLLNFLGTVQCFNGVDVKQTENYNYIHCSIYIEKIVEHHNWKISPHAHHQHLCKQTTNTKEISN